MHAPQYNVCMIRFEWDQPKATANLKKHGISFEEAQSVFYDEFAFSSMTMTIRPLKTDSSCLA